MGAPGLCHRCRPGRRNPSARPSPRPPAARGSQPARAWEPRLTGTRQHDGAQAAVLPREQRSPGALPSLPPTPPLSAAAGCLEYSSSSLKLLRRSSTMHLRAAQFPQPAPKEQTPPQPLPPPACDRHHPPPLIRRRPCPCCCCCCCPPCCRSITRRTRSAASWSTSAAAASTR